MYKKIRNYYAFLDVLYATKYKGIRVNSLCSFQKSGRTWVRYFLANYINLNYKLNIDIDIISFYDFAPSYKYDQIKKSCDKIDFYIDDIPLTLSTHSIYKKHLFSNTPIIFIIRSVYDVMASYYFHKKHHVSSYTADISSFIRSENGVQHLVKYMNSWSRYLINNKHLMVSYEDMHSSTKNTFTEIILYLNIPLDHKVLMLAIEKSTFKKMQESEINHSIPEVTYNIDNVNARRMRNGIVGDNSKNFSLDDIEYIKNFCQDNLFDESKKIYKDAGIEL